MATDALPDTFPPDDPWKSAGASGNPDAHLAAYQRLLDDMARSHEPWQSLPGASNGPGMLAPQPRVEFSPDAVDRYRVTTFAHYDPQTGDVLFTHSLSGEKYTSLLMRTAFATRHPALECHGDEVITIASGQNAYRFLSNDPILHMPGVIEINDHMLPEPSDNLEIVPADLDTSITANTQAALRDDPENTMDYLARKLRMYLHIIDSPEWELQYLPIPEMPQERWQAAGILTQTAIDQNIEQATDSKLTSMYAFAEINNALSYCASVIAVEYGITELQVMSNVITRAVLS